MEVWKDIEGFEGLYQVSDCGNVRNKNGHIMRPATRQDGRLHVILSKGGKKYTRKVHRLVAAAFIPNPNNYPQINHKDENPANNNAVNLEWCDELYNHHYGTAIERMAESMKGKFTGAKSVRSKPLFQYSLDGYLIAEWGSIYEAARVLGVHYSNICLCCTGKRKSAGGYIWTHEKRA